MSAARRDRLLEMLHKEGVQAALITHPVNVSYLTGFSGDSTYLIVSARRTIIVSDGRFTDQLAGECPGLEMVIRPPTQSVADAAASTIDGLGLTSVGFESGHLTVADFEDLCSLTPSVAWKPGPDRVEQLRRVKDAGEIEQIRQAIRFAEQAFAMLRAELNRDDSEKDLVDSLEHNLRRAGARGSAFPSIVAVGSNAALPHAPPTTRRVAEAPLVLVDWGASGPFYKSDLTRVLLAHNNSASTDRSRADLPARLVEVYGIVLEAQLRAIAAVRPGVACKDVDAAARGVIAAAGYGEYFTHSVGHGIGMMIHEAPFMRANTEMVLEPGMVVTVEPGIYLPGYAGVRIEDDVLVTPDGSEVLTRVPKTMEAALHLL